MSSILETFYILFKSDSSDVKKGSDEAKQSTNKLNESLKSTHVSTEKLGKSFLGVTNSLARMVATFLSARAIIGGIKDVYQYTQQLQIASAALGVSATDLDAWGNAVRRNGGTGEAFQSSIKNLATTLNIRNSDALKLLPGLADTFQRAGSERAQSLGSKLGLDQATIMTLQSGRREVEAILKRQRELGLVTKQDTEITRAFNIQWEDTAHTFRSLFITVATTILPVLQKVIAIFADVAQYFKRHSNLIVGALIAIGIASAIAAAPLLVTTAIVGGLIAAFALLYDDIAAFVQGNDSLIGRMLEKWPLVGRVITSVFESIKEAINYVLDKYNEFRAFLGWGRGGDVDFRFKTASDNLDAAARSPINSQTSSSLLAGNTSSRRSTDVYTGPITINTQATDAEGIGTALSNGLRDQMRQAIGTFDDGVLA